MQLPINDQQSEQQPWSYLVPFQRYLYCRFSAENSHPTIFYVKFGAIPLHWIVDVGSLKSEDAGLIIHVITFEVT